jgi:hypothetical protein
LGRAGGIPVTLAVLGVVTLLGFVLAARLWPSDDPEEIAHGHPDLPPDHPHLREHRGVAHAHAFTIDDLHRRWPSGQATGQDSAPVSGRT